MTGEGNGSPPQCSCLESPVDGGAWWAAVHGAAQSGTWLTRLSMHACIGEGNGSPLQCSCLDNTVDGGVWWAAVHGVAQSRTRLKQLSSSSSEESVTKQSHWELGFNIGILKETIPSIISPIKALIHTTKHKPI